jgi:hypothetical protein
MGHQLVLFKDDPTQVSTSGIWNHLTPTQQDKAVQHLAEIMVHTITIHDSEPRVWSGKEKKDD